MFVAELLTGRPIFPGQSEIDQLYLIQKLLGPLTKEQTKMFFKNPMFNGYKFPDMTACEGLERRFLGKVSKTGLAFMKGCLKIDPKDRFTAEDCMNHKFFEGLEKNEPVLSPTTQESTQDLPQERGVQKPSLQTFGSKGNLVHQQTNQPSTITYSEQNSVNSRKKKIITRPIQASEMMTGNLVDGMPEESDIYQGNKRGKSRQSGRERDEATTPPRASSRAEKIIEKKRKPIQIDLNKHESINKPSIPKTVQTKPVNLSKIVYTSSIVDRRVKPTPSKQLKQLNPLTDSPPQTLKQHNYENDIIDQENDNRNIQRTKKEVLRAPSSISENVKEDTQASISPRASGEKFLKTRKSKSNLTLRNSIKGATVVPDSSYSKMNVSPIKTLPKLSHQQQGYPYTPNWGNVNSSIISEKTSGRKSASKKSTILNTDNLDDLEKELYDHFLNDHLYNPSPPSSSEGSRQNLFALKPRDPAVSNNNNNPQNRMIHLKPIQINN